MRLPNLLWIFVWSGIAIFSCQSSSESNPDNQPLPDIVDFNYHIKPILSDRCFACHGPDKNSREADLRLDMAADALERKTESGHPPFKASKSNESEAFLRMISEDPDVVMPPPESNLSLSKREIALIKKWINQGAEYKDHWSFIPPQKTDIQLNKSENIQNEIDHFISQKIKENGLKASGKESKEKLLRRASFDLTGLPPSPEALAEFINDDSPNAFEKQVDQLLASSAYGERMAVIWLEVARYADSHGYQDDRPRTMWPWRDWVIKAYNENLPYDQFIHYQLAGDLLPDATYEQKLATGFNRNHAITQEGGVINEEYVTEYVADRTNTMSTAFMGLTMECARCHDHKYDPISQKDYYQMFAFFNTIDERGQVNYFDLSPAPNMRMESEDMEAQIAYIDSLTKLNEDELERIAQKPGDDFRSWLEEEYSKLDLSDKVNEGLLAWHSLDEFNNLTTINNVNPNLPGKANVKLVHDLEPLVSVEGKMGKALEFDGYNYHSLGEVGDFEHWDRFSFGGWVKAEKPKEKKAGVFVRRNGEQKQAGYEMVITPKGQIEVALVYDRNSIRIEVTTKSRIQFNEWQHLFATYDGSGRAKGVTIFLNGKKQPVTIGKDNLEGRSILNGNDFLLGNYTPRRFTSNDYEGFFNGIIDEPRIYDRTLSSIEVDYLANGKWSPGNPNAPEAKEYYVLNESPQFKLFDNKLDSLRRIPKEIPNVMIMEEMEEPRESFILARGAYDAPTEKVNPNTPPTILPFPEELPQNRLGLAKWLTHRDNPLTSRVAINRLWQMIFGRGLVSTPEDFGNQGALPSHPELLDWLAVEFMDSGWDVKHMLKLMVMSAAYQRASAIDQKSYQVDPDNIYLARGPYKRLSAEMMRDQALAVSGLLNSTVGGHWVKPYQPPGIWKELANQIGENKYRPSKGSNLYRRSLYSYWKRTIPPPVMLTFDASERAVCVVKRQNTNTPLQALVLLNDPQYVEASRVLAERMISEGGETLEGQIAMGFRLATSRSPKEEEIELLINLFEKEKARFSEQKDQANSFLEIGDASIQLEKEPDYLSALTVIANILLNLDESKMKS